MLARSIGWLQETIDKVAAAVWTCKAALLFEGSCCALVNPRVLRNVTACSNQTSLCCVVCISHAKLGAASSVGIARAVWLALQAPGSPAEANVKDVEATFAFEKGLWAVAVQSPSLCQYLPGRSIALVVWVLFPIGRRKSLSPTLYKKLAWRLVDCKNWDHLRSQTATVGHHWLNGFRKITKLQLQCPQVVLPLATQGGRWAFHEILK